jgi:hypothetical protein
MNTIFKTEKDKKEFVAAFRRLTMSGAVDKDKAIEKLIRDNPNYFHQPTADDIVKISHSAMNDEMRRRARQSNKLSVDIFRRPADKQKPS